MPLSLLPQPDFTPYSETWLVSSLFLALFHHTGGFGRTEEGGSTSGVLPAAQHPTPTRSSQQEYRAELFT